MTTMNFRRMVFTMRQAQKAFYKYRTRHLQNTAMLWERKVDKWLEENAQEEIKAQLFSSGRGMPELPGVYNVGDETKTEGEAGA